MDNNFILISLEKAESKYGIICEHSEMPNGEVRFRLKKNDGTSYIRTESSPNGAWQNSHYHNKILETYIVQEGWICYAEFIDNKPFLNIYTKNQQFTTKPYIIHNIYMPGNAVIHTVKHGDSKDETRLINDETKKFDEITKNLTEDQIKSIAINGPPKTDNFDVLQEYNEPYRHFDNLIWQVPAWSSGIFLAILIAISSLRSSDPLILSSGFDFDILLSVLYGLASFIMLTLSYSLYRFRWHQSRVKNYIPKVHCRSPQFGLQLVVNIQFVFLLFLSCSFLNDFLFVKIAIALVVLFFISLYQEIVLKKHGKTGNKPESTRS